MTRRASWTVLSAVLAAFAACGSSGHQPDAGARPSPSTGGTDKQTAAGGAGGGSGSSGSGTPRGGTGGGGTASATGGNSGSVAAAAGGSGAKDAGSAATGGSSAVASADSAVPPDVANQMGLCCTDKQVCLQGTGMTIQCVDRPAGCDGPVRCDCFATDPCAAYTARCFGPNGPGDRTLRCVR